MANYGLFNTRVNAYGETSRERTVNTAKDDIAKNLYEHPNLRDVKIGSNSNKASEKIVVISTNDQNVKQIHSLPSEGFTVGQYIEFSNNNWLIDKADVDNELYVDGQMTLCPNIIKFQDKTGVIHSYPYFVDTSLSSLDENKTITTSSTTRKIKLPLDELTRGFFIDKRFMGEVLGGKPQCWKVNEMDADSNRGLLVVTLEKDEFNEKTDSIECGICNYFEATTPVVLDETIEIVYNGKPELRMGGNYKDFYAKYYDSNGEEILNIDSTWTIEAHPLFESNIISQIDGNKISLKVESIIGFVGQTVSLTVVGDNNTKAQIDIAIVPLF